MLEFTIGSAALSVSSGYRQELLAGTAFEVPIALASAADGLIDLPAVVIALVVRRLLIRGTKFSSRVNQVVVAIKLAVVAAVIVVGIAYVDVSNWVPFIPDSQPVPESEGGFLDQPLVTSLLGIEPAISGVGGVVAGAAVVFFAFILVTIGVVVLRRTRPDLPRAFRTPAAPLVAVLATLLCLYLMLNLDGETWVRFLVWMALGVVVYFVYGRGHSRLGRSEAVPSVTSAKQT